MADPAIQRRRAAVKALPLSAAILMAERADGLIFLNVGWTSQRFFAAHHQRMSRACSVTVLQRWNIVGKWLYHVLRSGLSP